MFFALSAALRVSGGLQGVLFATFLFGLFVFLLHVLGCVLERFWMHLCSFFCICSLVVLPLGLGFRDKFERFLTDLLDTCLKFLLHSLFLHP